MLIAKVMTTAAKTSKCPNVAKDEGAQTVFAIMLVFVVISVLATACNAIDNERNDDGENATCVKQDGQWTLFGLFHPLFGIFFQRHGSNVRTTVAVRQVS